MSHFHEVKAEVARSFTISWEQGVPRVVSSGWVVGYTPGYRATPGEAIAFAMEKLQEEMQLAAKNHDALKVMLEEYRAQ